MTDNESRYYCDQCKKKKFYNRPLSARRRCLQHPVTIPVRPVTAPSTPYVPSSFIYSPEYVCTIVPAGYNPSHNGSNEYYNSGASGHTPS